MGAVGWLPPWDQNRSLRDITFREEMLLPCEHGSITALRLKRLVVRIGLYGFLLIWGFWAIEGHRPVLSLTS